MQHSQRLGATLLAASIVLILGGAPSANAQPFEHVQPLYHVDGAAHTGVVGHTPAQIKRAYGFDKVANEGKGQVIAIVDAFDDPKIEGDLGVFNHAFNLPACTTANGCFKKVFATGTNPGTNNPDASFWALEMALDVEWAHAIAPKATILLVEAASDTLDSLLAGVDVAVASNPRPSVVSMSWGGAEFSSQAAAAKKCRLSSTNYPSGVELTLR
jgi:subtilase family serine protease